MLKIIIVVAFTFVLIASAIAGIYGCNKKKLLQYIGIASILGVLTGAVLSFIVMVF